MSKVLLCKHIDSCEPPNIDYRHDEYEAICKKTVHSLIDAKKYAEALLLTSGISSDDGDELEETLSNHEKNDAVSSPDIQNDSGSVESATVHAGQECSLNKFVSYKLDEINYQLKEIKTMVCELGNQLRRVELNNPRIFVAESSLKLPVATEEELLNIETQLEDDAKFMELVKH